MVRSLIRVSAVLLMAKVEVALAATPLGPGFTYQGRVLDNGLPVTDTSPGCDFEFSLFADAGGVTQVGAPQFVLGVPVVDGLFTVELNAGGAFSPDAFNGEERYLRIAIRCPPDGVFTTLSPLQKLSAAPFAHFALNAPAGTPWQTAGNDISYSAGDVGIGTTNPTGRFDVDGNFVVRRQFVALDQAQESGAVTATPPNWQSFTAGASGMLTRVEVRASTVNSDPVGTLEIRSGEGTGGTVLAAQDFTDFPVGTSEWFSIPLSFPPHIQADQQYTLHFSSNNRFLAAIGNPYPGGSFRGTSVDLVFLTFVSVPESVGVGIGTTNPSNALSVVGNADISGNVGIGTANPSSALSVVGNAGISGNVGIGTTNPSSALSVVGNADISGNVGIGTTNPSNALSVAGDTDISGNVGIGTTSPDRALSILGNDAGGVAQWLSLKNLAGITTWHLNNLNDGLNFTETTIADGRLFLAPGGNVGIGTTNPTRGRVDIEGGQDFDLGSYGFLNGGGSTGTFGGGTNSYSLFTSDRIAASEFNAHSDARIKRIASRSDSARDLSTLMDIEVTDYTMVDTVAHGGAPCKKVIGQQVKSVFPQAVSTSSDVVPDIYRMAEADAGWIRLDGPAEPPLQVGDQVRLITDDGVNLHAVVEVNEDRFRVAAPLTGKVFVYGREVNDFHHVDYGEIAMLNVSATQELNRILQEQLRVKRARISEQENEIADLRARLERIEGLLSVSGPAK